MSNNSLKDNAKKIMCLGLTPLVALIMFGTSSSRHRVVNNNPYTSVRCLDYRHGFLNIGHRGVSAWEIENSREAIVSSMDLSCSDITECDIIECDGRLFVHHGNTVINGDGEEIDVSDLTVEELLMIDIKINRNDETILTAFRTKSWADFVKYLNFRDKTTTILPFEELLKQAIEKNEPLLLDLFPSDEQDDYLDKLSNEIKKSGLDNSQISFQCRDYEFSKKVKLMFPEYEVGLIVMNWNEVNKISNYEYDFVSLQRTELNQEALKLIPEGTKLFIWTINSRSQLFEAYDEVRLSGRNYVLGIIGDDPSKNCKYIEEYLSIHPEFRMINEVETKKAI